ncbi:MAG TPA: hypothetical protein VGM20_07160 [Gemmatimonadales bacterium]|jgi:hypothetical protein
MSRFWPRLRALITLSAIVGVAWALLMMGWVGFSMVRGHLPVTWMWTWIVNTAPLIFFIGLGFGTAFIAALATLRPKDGLRSPVSHRTQ